MVLLVGIGAIPVTLGLTLIVVAYTEPSSGPMGHIGALFGLCLLIPGAVALLLTWWLRRGRQQWRTRK